MLSLIVGPLLPALPSNLLAIFPHQSCATQSLPPNAMKRRSFVKMMGAATAAATTPLFAAKEAGKDKVTIALVPGLTADGF